jgi:hypothetical protein
VSLRSPKWKIRRLVDRQRVTHPVTARHERAMLRTLPIAAPLGQTIKMVWYHQGRNRTTSLSQKWTIRRGDRWPVTHPVTARGERCLRDTLAETWMDVTGVIIRWRTLRRLALDAPASRRRNRLRRWPTTSHEWASTNGIAGLAPGTVGMWRFRPLELHGRKSLVGIRRRLG